MAPKKKTAAAVKTATAKAAAEAKAKAAAEAAAKAKADLFDQAVDFVLKEKIEGGYVNDPRDPGGETNFGISKRSYPKVDMKTLTREGAVAIYKRDYWDAADCDKLPPMIAVAVFDCAVNQGVTIAKKLLQKAAGVANDGVIGPVSLTAIHKANEEELLVQYLGWRLRRYSGTANAATYMRGWANRVLYLQRFVLNDLLVA